MEATQEGTLLKLNFRAKDVYLVVSGGTGSLHASTYIYTQDDKVVKQKALQEKDISITHDDLYHVFS
ncbi:hypothetical protein H6768_02015 [Candidatus Peribacteria bacterium]|nr:hypothetical protein [Candidatus Peribacteria bacterium]